MIDVASQYQQLRRSVADRHGDVAAGELDQTFAVVQAAHHGQVRKSGDPYVTHPIAVANIVNGWGNSHHPGLSLDLTRTFDRNAAVIKIADRLHNARTWHFVPQQKAQVKARETLALIAPAASTLSLIAAAEELRALSVATLAQPLLARSTLGVTTAFLQGALRVLPAEMQQRYEQEWLADLAQLSTRRERVAMTAGLLWSAWAIRRQSP